MFHKILWVIQKTLSNFQFIKVIILNGRPAKFRLVAYTHGNAGDASRKNIYKTDMPECKLKAGQKLYGELTEVEKCRYGIQPSCVCLFLPFSNLQSMLFSFDRIE
jgi:hypothetical protein